MGKVSYLTGIFFVFFLSICAAEEKQEADKLVLYAFMKKAPLLDGKLDDVCWQDAQTAVGFCKLGLAELAEPGTKVKVCYDEKNLYLGISLDEPLIGQLKSDKKSPWNGDCIELFFKPHQINEKLYHIIIDCSGNIYRGVSQDNYEKIASFPVKAVTSADSKSWNLEIEIPFTAFYYSKPPVDNAEWKFNVVRTRRAAGNSGDYASWSKVDQFTQYEKFGCLAFYANPEIEADLAFWDNSKRSGLMDRPEVSGVKFALQNAGKETFPNLWDYSPFVKRDKMAETWGMRGLTRGTKEKYPEMYRAATQLNALLIEKSFADEQLNELYRAGISKSALNEYLVQSEKINKELNRFYQIYGSAYKKDRNKMPQSLFSEMDKLGEIIRKQKEIYTTELSSLRSDAAKKSGIWEVSSLKAEAGEKYLNSSGYSRRYLFVAHEFLYNTDSLLPLGPFVTHQLLRNYTYPKQESPDAAWDYSFLKTGLEQLRAYGFSRIYCPFTIGLHDLGSVMLPEIEGKPGIHMKSADNLPPYTQGAACHRQERASNIHSKELNDFLKKYLRKTLAEILQSGLQVDFFLIAQEAKNTFKVFTKGDEKEERSMGFTPEGQADFHKYLKNRYTSVDELNTRWHSGYKSFDEINPANDKFIKPPSKLSGLAFEHERWSRVTFLQWLKANKNLFHEAAPGIPVMEDMSLFLIDGNIYLAFQEDCADIMSFHSGPSRELPIWNFMYSINRNFGKLLGYYENYFAMFSKKYMNNERLAKREVDKFFFELFMHDITVSSWWLRYCSTSGSYLASYNCNPSYLEYDQTVFRWSTTALPVMFRKGLSIEKMLLNTETAKSKTAMIQPCTSIFALSALGYTIYDSPSVNMLYDLHNNLLRPANIPYEFLPEEMVLDKHAALNDYECLVLPYAPYMTNDFSKQIKNWVNDGGTLIAFGPFSIYDETGSALPPEVSLLKTVFPDSTIGAKPWDFSLSGKNEGPLIVEKKFGKGKLIVFNRDMLVLQQDVQLKAKLEDIFAGISKPVTCSDKNFRSVLRYGKDASVWLAVNNISADKALNTKFKINGEFKQIYDVMIPGWLPVKSSVDNGKTECNIQLCPGDWTVLKLK